MKIFICILIATLIGASFGYFVGHLYIWSTIGFVLGCLFSLIIRLTAKIPAMLDDLFKSF